MTNRPNPARRNAKSRSAILAATRALITEAGYQKVSIEAIAAKAGVGKQTIYRWWPSKGAVVFDAILALSEGDPEQENHGAEKDSGTMALPDTGDLEADLKTVLRATVAEFTDPAFEAPVRALNIEIAGDPELAAGYRERMAAPMAAVKKDRLRSGQRAGQLDSGADLDLVIDLLWSPIAQRWLLRTGALDDAFADGLVDAVLRAFAPS
ncbi:TetR family transcriptional regulator [Prauserella marina]|uniref:DNA-binding transcriptional regulator, AcrR family n=1 Tax=Prauserella marina TaxID=530584 RepID=A0A222VKS8_9PSEU|nr:TetR/AcrR family transcriptional regulator [Prauserella marina]ASR34530.1 TetR family transcriptional regulator [Prauserella marina]PWV85864.1 TetR family transcriptional regulator [Prauserella marina]SDC43621.1 DNA-binding transcriptional regulator, AcrR family [Prauserella marina]